MRRVNRFTGVLLFIGSAALGISLAMGRHLQGGTPAVAAPAAPEAKAVNEVVLFDFENEDDIEHWSNLQPAPDAPATKTVWASGDKDHPVKGERVAEHATSGKHSLRLTFSGGITPALTTRRVPLTDLSAFKTFKADVTVGRPCVVFFRVIFEKSTREDPDSRFEKAALLHAGKNEVVGFAFFREKTKAVAFDIGMYKPREGESIYVDNIRLTKTRPNLETPIRIRHYQTPGDKVAPDFPKLEKKFKVLGTDWEVASPLELADRVKDQWVKSDKEATLEEVERAFQARYEELKKEYPQAILARFRDGDTGWDPRDPAKKFDGWKDCYLHGHDGPGWYLQEAVTKSQRSKAAAYGIDQWRNCPLMRVDLASIPKGSRILTARLVLTRAPGVKAPPGAGTKPALFVAQPCNRAWKEDEVNSLEYAKDLFWHEVCATELNGADPDTLPLILAYGHSRLGVSAWDFTQAVQHWTGGQPNHGFMFYQVGGRFDHLVANTRKCAEVKKRPALLVVYVPPS
jgi:hypothetical protein